MKQNVPVYFEVFPPETDKGTEILQTATINTTIFAAALFVFVQLVVDIAYSLMDPRNRVK